ncbi:MAG: HisS family protein [Sphaerobacter sp.]|nr:HisS family protein [Sphaerobacter sp.]
MKDADPYPRATHSPIERLRGMVDIDPARYQARRVALDRILATFDRHGYRPIETPVVEPTELFLRKSGGERVAQMYAFHYRDREIALRPEHTASVLRMYADSLQGEPLPLRLAYAGPVFRYEKPQAGRTRQFTEVGCELLGAEGPAADAEVIHLALEGLRAVGVDGRLVLGHIGIVLDFLNRLPLRQRARDWLIWSMERLRKGQDVDPEAALAGLVTGDRLATVFTEMSATLKDIPPDQLEGWVLAILREVGVQVQGGTRSPEEIVAGLIAKMHRQSDAADVRRAFDFVRELAAVQGAPGEVLPAVRALTHRHGLDDAPIERLERVLDLLAAYGHPVDAIELSLGLGRGLHYYTGMLFEIYPAGQPGLQLCGGGRYDDLAQMLGTRQPLPACGFSYGLERVVGVAGITAAAPVPEVLVVPRTPAAAAAAIHLSERLRGEGRRVEIDVRGRSVQSSRRYALRRGIPEVRVVDETGQVTVEPVQRRDPAAPTAEASDD